MADSISARYGIPCPVCGAAADESCRTMTTYRVTDTHKARIDAWLRKRTKATR